jgi:hypothetical protein
VTFARWQIRLRGRSTNATKCRDERDADIPREIFGLIESALAPSRRMKRNGNDKVSFGQHIGASCPHQSTKGLGQRSTAVVLQRVNDRAQCPVVSPDGS